MTEELKTKFLTLRSEWKEGKLTNQQYLNKYYALGKENNLILYYPLQLTKKKQNVKFLLKICEIKKHL